jgi:hypothetical protein
MNWFGKYVIEPNGMLHWREGMLVTDGPLYRAYQLNSLVQFVVEESVTLGVTVGQA